MATITKKADEPVKKMAGSAKSKTKSAAQPEGAVKASAAKKSAAPKKAASAKTPPTPKAPAVKKKESQTGASAPEQKPAVPELTPEQRRLYVEVAAYYIAERRGFVGGSELEDWVQAEAEIDRLLREGILKP
ncbi:MAG: DUF2934 domain-containing protein [Rhodocyclaceae bacterium]